MTASIIEFSPGPGRFTCHVEVREHWAHGGALCYFVVEVLDHDGRHRVETFSDPDEAERFAEGFRRAHREQFAKDIARRRGKGRHRAPTPWWLEDSIDRHQSKASHDCPPDPWFPGGGGAA